MIWHVAIGRRVVETLWLFEGSLLSEQMVCMGAYLFGVPRLVKQLAEGPMIEVLLPALGIFLTR